MKAGARSRRKEWRQEQGAGARSGGRSKERSNERRQEKRAGARGGGRRKGWRQEQARAAIKEIWFRY